MFVFNSCGKYEEGPGFSVLTKTMRITGVWKFDKMLSNGVEIELDEYMSSSSYEMLSDGTGKISFEFGGTIISSDLEWEFNSDKTHLRVRIKDGGVFGEWEESEIIRLTNKEFWIKDTEDGETTEIRMKKE